MPKILYNAAAIYRQTATQLSRKTVICQVKERNNENQTSIEMDEYNVNVGKVVFRWRLEIDIYNCTGRNMGSINQ